MKFKNLETGTGSLGERDVIAMLSGRNILLAPVSLSSVMPLTSDQPHADVKIEAKWEERHWTFAAEIKSRGTPQQVQLALSQVKQSTLGLHPMIIVPFLSEAALELLEREQVSGIDLCGNGLLIVPGELLVRRSGQANRYTEISPLKDPYSGKAGVVSRRLAMRLDWPSLDELHEEIGRDVVPISMGLCSKVVSALSDENLIVKDRRRIRVRDRLGLLSGLAKAWSRVRARRRQEARLVGSPEKVLAQHLGDMLWTIGGGSSSGRYALVAQAGPIEVMVENIELAMQRCRAEPEDIPAFAQVIFREYDEPGAFCGAQVDADGVRWSGPLQAWLELQAGDARQRTMANDIFRRFA